MLPDHIWGTVILTGMACTVFTLWVCMCVCVCVCVCLSVSILFTSASPWDHMRGIKQKNKSKSEDA